MTPDGDPELFWATAGGMGLTGFITRATIQLKRVETSLVTVDTVKTARHRRDDGRAGRARQEVRLHGRLVRRPRDRRAPRPVDHHQRRLRAVGDLPPSQRADPFAFDPRARLGAPPAFPPGLMNRYSIRLANAAWYRKAPRLREHELQTISQFFHPLDGIRNWNRVYGPGGFRQYQYVHAVRRRGRRPPLVRDGRRAPGAVLRDRAQAIRPGRPRPAVVPDGRLDARARLPGPHPRPRPAPRRARPAGGRPRRPGLPGQGLPGERGDARADVPAPARVPQAPRRA